MLQSLIATGGFGIHPIVGFIVNAFCPIFIVMLFQGLILIKYLKEVFPFMVQIVLNITITQFEGRRSGSAIVLGNFPVLGRPTYFGL